MSRIRVCFCCLNFERCVVRCIVVLALACESLPALALIIIIIVVIIIIFQNYNKL